jgi:hypothetical protein
MAKPVVYTEEQIEKASYPDIENTLITSKIPLSRLDTPHGRTYYQRGLEAENRRYLYSSTTILDNVLAKGIGFSKWLGNSLSYDAAMIYARERANVGTCVHALCMHLIWGETIDCTHGYFNEDSMSIESIPDEVKLRLQAFIDFCHDNDPESIATEIGLYTLDETDDGELLYPWAGTADNVMKIKDKMYLLDIKTGKEYKHPHELQLTSYKILWDHIYGEEHGKIDKMVGLYLNNKGKYKLVEYKFAMEEWFWIYEIFEYMLKNKRGSMPKIKIKEELPNKYSIKPIKGEEDAG